jgi:outer membrane protein TolC
VQPFDLQDDIPLSDPPEMRPDFPAIADETPDLRTAEAQERSARAEIRSSRSYFFPRLDLGGAAGRTGDSFFPEDNHWSVGVTLTVPLFDGGRDWYGSKGAVSSWEASLQNRLSVRRQLLSKLEQLFHAYVEAIAKLRVDQSFRDAAVLRAEVARRKYNNGLLSFDDWDVIENDLIARQRSSLLSERDRVIAEAAWEQGQGKGVIP